MSSAEAEYVVAARCCAQVLWVKSQLVEYDVLYDKVPIFYDNTSAISIFNNPILHSKTKHIDIRYYFIRDYILKGDIKLHFVPTDLQLADIFTKPLVEPSFTRLVAELVEQPLFFTQDEFILAIGLPICKTVVPLPPKETVRAGLATVGLFDKGKPSLSSTVLVNSSPLKIKFVSLFFEKMLGEKYINNSLTFVKPHTISVTSFQKPLASEVPLTLHMLKVIKLFQEPKQSLILSFEKVNVDDSTDKSFYGTSVQPITQLKAPTDLKTKKKKIPPSSKPKSSYKVRVILLKKQVAKTQNAEEIKATANATQSLGASESAEDLVFKTLDSASQEGTAKTLNASADMPAQSDPLGHLHEELRTLNTKRKKVTDDEPPIKKLKFLIQASSILSPTPLNSILPEPLQKPDATQITIEQFTEHLNKTTSSIFSPTPPREPTPPRDPTPPGDKSKGKSITTEEPLKDFMPFIKGGSTPKIPSFKSFVISEGKLTNEDVMAQVKEMKRLDNLKAEKEKSATSKSKAMLTDLLLQCLKANIEWVLTQAKKLGIPPPPELSTFGISVDDMKRKRSLEIPQEVFMKENIVVNRMQRNLIPPQGIKGSRDRVIRKPESRIFYFNGNFDLLFQREEEFHLATTGQLIRL
ncbi:hypothetical protein Tco_1440406 [Tanacetum coccineum]